MDLHATNNFDFYVEIMSHIVKITMDKWTYEAHKYKKRMSTKRCYEAASAYQLATSGPFHDHVIYGGKR